MHYINLPHFSRTCALGCAVLFSLVANQATAQSDNNSTEDNILNARYSHQSSVDPDFVRQLEANRWIKMDTVVHFNPETYTGTTEVYQLDFSPAKDASGEWVYKLADEMPVFPGGEEAMSEYVSNNIRTPKGGDGGAVFVRLVIDQSGALRDAEALGTASDVYKNEALRLVRQMPEWTPGVKEGKKVNCEVVVPIQF